MSKKHALSVAIMFILVLQILTFSLSGIGLDEKSISEISPISSEPIPQIEVSGAGGEDPLRANIVYNPSFEETRSNGGPQDWGFYGSSYRLVNITYQDDIHLGSYSARFQAKGIQWSSEAYAYEYFYAPPNEDVPYLSEDLYLSLWWKGVSIYDMDRGTRFYFSLEFYDGSSYRYLRYNVMYGSSYNPSNSTSTKYLMINGTMNSWNSLTRDIDSDFNEAYGSISGYYVRSIFAYAYCPSDSSGVSELLVDDVAILNSSVYNFMRNGDFEGSGEWGYQNEAPGYAMTTDIQSTDGLQSVNLTASNTPEATDSYIYLDYWIGYPQGAVPFGPGEMILEFDWMYSDTANGGASQNAIMTIDLANETWQDVEAHYYLGEGDDVQSLANTSTHVRFTAPGYGIRDSWHHLSVDLYDIYDYFNITAGAFNDINLECSTSSQENSTVNLLVDDFKFVTYPTIDPGFEQDWYWNTGNSIPSWYRQGSSYPYQNVTTDAHTGKYAANLTVWNGPNAEIYKNPFLPFTSDIYTDIWWRLDYINGDESSMSYVRLGFEDGYNLYYITAGTILGSLANTSSAAFYFVDGFNQTGSWMNIVRNPLNDLEAVFDSHQWNLTYISLYADSSSNTNMSILYDDINFVLDTHAPVISDVDMETSNPMYYDDVKITAAISDLGPVDAQLHFNNGSDYSVDMTKVNDRYVGWITPTAYDVEVTYYITATDSFSLSSTDDNSGELYSYTTGDDINPTIVITEPDSSETVEGMVQFELEVDDPGVGSSGVDRIELWEGSNLLMTDSDAPFELNWNSRSVSNGTHNLGAKVFDNAGNSAIDNVSIIVDNDVEGPIISDVVMSPVVPIYDQDVDVSVTVTDATEIENVTLYLRVNGAEWIPIEMESSGILYSATIWGRPWGTEIEYYIIAFDSFGISSMVGSDSAPLGYIIGDDVAPVISVSGPSTSEELKGIVSFYISASDSGSGVAGYSISIDGTEIEDGTGGLTNELFSFDTTTYENGNYTLAFTVADNAGNVVTFEVEYEISNPIGLDALTESFNDLMTSYGFFVGAATIILVVAVIQILLRKRRAA